MNHDADVSIVISLANTRAQIYCVKELKEVKWHFITSK